jgi:hypothetical protein
MNEKQSKRLRRAQRDAIKHLVAEQGEQGNPHQIAERTSDSAYVVRLGSATMSHRERGKLGDILRGWHRVRGGEVVEVRPTRRPLREVFSTRVGVTCPDRLFAAARFARPFCEVA